MAKDRCWYGNLEPELAHCRTAHVGAVIPGTTVGLYYCLQENGDCRYARSFGYDYVCKHAASHTFVDPCDIAAGEPE
jgi:hypothetical protein